MCAARPMAAAASISAALQDFDTAIQLNPNFYQAYSNRALIQRFLGDQARRAGRLQPLDPDQSRTMTPPISAAATSTAKRAAPGSLQRFPEGDPARHDRRARLSQSRPDLSEPGPAQISPSRISRPRSRWRRTPPNPTTAAALSYLATERRGQRLRRLQHGDQARRQDRRKLGQPGADLRAARRQGARRRNPTARPSGSIPTTSRPSTAWRAPAPADRRAASAARQACRSAWLRPHDVALRSP